jgi:ribosomal subunit interface protein
LLTLKKGGFMQVKIIGENIEVTQAISDYIHKKIFSLNLPEHLHNMEFRIGKENLFQYVKFFTNSGKQTFIIKQNGQDLYYAIDLITERMKKSFRRSKEKNHLSFRKERHTLSKRDWNKKFDENLE